MMLVKASSPAKHEGLFLEEAGFELMFTSNPLPMWVFDHETLAFLEVNEAAVASYGYTRDEFLNMTIKDLRPAEDHERLDAYLESKRDAFRKAGEWRHQLKSGDMIVAEIHSHTVEFQDRTCVLVVAQDVTERKRVEHDLLASTERLSAIVATQQELLADAEDMQHLYDLVASRAHALTAAHGAVLELVDGDDVVYRAATGTLDGHRGARVKIGENLSGYSVRTGEVLRCDDTEQDPRVDRELCRSMNVRSLVVAPLSLNQEVFGLIKVIAPEPHTFEAEDSHAMQLLASMAAAVIKRRQAEEEAYRLNDELEERVAKRTSQLEAANKELEAFSYSVSHDLRAPLRAINGFARILQEDCAAQLPDDAQEYLSLIRDNAQQMGWLIDDLLAFSRLSRQPLKTQQVALTPLVQQVLNDLHDERAGRQIEIKLDTLPDCAGDPTLIKQLLTNLLSNALKFTRQRAVARIDIGCQQQPNGCTYFIRDNGAGFDMRYVDKLFGVFQRLHLAEEYEGTGVGLAIVQRVAARHGGRVWAEGELNRGATFYFTLPGVRERGHLE